MFGRSAALRAVPQTRRPRWKPAAASVAAMESSGSLSHSTHPALHRSGTTTSRNRSNGNHPPRRNRWKPQDAGAVVSGTCTVVAPQPPVAPPTPRASMTNAEAPCAPPSPSPPVAHRNHRGHHNSDGSPSMPSTVPNGADSRTSRAQATATISPSPPMPPPTTSPEKSLTEEGRLRNQRSSSVIEKGTPAPVVTLASFLRHPAAECDCWTAVEWALFYNKNSVASQPKVPLSAAQAAGWILYATADVQAPASSSSSSSSPDETKRGRGDQPPVRKGGSTARVNLYALQIAERLSSSSCSNGSASSSPSATSSAADVERPSVFSTIVVALECAVTSDSAGSSAKARQLSRIANLLEHRIPGELLASDDLNSSPSDNLDHQSVAREDHRLRQSTIRTPYVRALEWSNRVLSAWHVTGLPVPDALHALVYCAGRTAPTRGPPLSTSMRVAEVTATAQLLSLTAALRVGHPKTIDALLARLLRIGHERSLCESAVRDVLSDCAPAFHHSNHGCGSDERHGGRFSGAGGHFGEVRGPSNDRTVTPQVKAAAFEWLEASHEAHASPTQDSVSPIQSRASLSAEDESALGEGAPQPDTPLTVLRSWGQRPPAVITQVERHLFSSLLCGGALKTRHRRHAFSILLLRWRTPRLESNHVNTTNPSAAHHRHLPSTLCEDGKGDCWRRRQFADAVHTAFPATSSSAAASVSAHVASSIAVTASAVPSSDVAATATMLPQSAVLGVLPPAGHDLLAIRCASSMWAESTVDAVLARASDGRASPLLLHALCAVVDYGAAPEHTEKIARWALSERDRAARRERSQPTPLHVFGATPEQDADLAALSSYPDVAKSEEEPAVATVSPLVTALTAPKAYQRYDVLLSRIAARQHYNHHHDHGHHQRKLKHTSKTDAEANDDAHDEPGTPKRPFVPSFFTFSNLGHLVPKPGQASGSPWSSDETAATKDNLASSAVAIPGTTALDALLPQRLLSPAGMWLWYRTATDAIHRRVFAAAPRAASLFDGARQKTSPLGDLKKFPVSNLWGSARRLAHRRQEQAQGTVSLLQRVRQKTHATIDTDAPLENGDVMANNGDADDREVLGAPSAATANRSWNSGRLDAKDFVLLWAATVCATETADYPDHSPITSDPGSKSGRQINRGGQLTRQRWFQRSHEDLSVAEIVDAMVGQYLPPGSHEFSASSSDATSRRKTIHRAFGAVGKARALIAEDRHAGLLPFSVMTVPNAPASTPTVASTSSSAVPVTRTEVEKSSGEAEYSSVRDLFTFTKKEKKTPAAPASQVPVVLETRLNGSGVQRSSRPSSGKGNTDVGGNDSSQRDYAAFDHALSVVSAAHPSPVAASVASFAASDRRTLRRAATLLARNRRSGDVVNTSRQANTRSPQNGTEVVSKRAILQHFGERVAGLPANTVGDTATAHVAEEGNGDAVSTSQADACAAFFLALEDARAGARRVDLKADDTNSISNRAFLLADAVTSERAVGHLQYLRASTEHFEKESSLPTETRACVGSSTFDDATSAEESTVNEIRPVQQVGTLGEGSERRAIRRALTRVGALKALQVAAVLPSLYADRATLGVVAELCKAEGRRVPAWLETAFVVAPSAAEASA